jgi:hypothetical protein
MASAYHRCLELLSCHVTLPININLISFKVFTGGHVNSSTALGDVTSKPKVMLLEAVNCQSLEPLVMRVIDVSVVTV